MDSWRPKTICYMGGRVCQRSNGQLFTVCHVVFIKQRDGTGKSRGFAITQHVNSLGLPQLAPVEVLLCWSDFHVLLPHSSYIYSP